MREIRIVPLVLLAVAVLCYALLRDRVRSDQTLTPVSKTPQAQDFNLPDINGQQHRLSDYLGKVVFINFWATWCPPCREEMPSMQRAWERLESQGVMMLAISVGEDRDTVSRFAKKHHIEFPLLLDPRSTMMEQWTVLGLPTTYIVDQQGRVIYHATGERDWDEPGLLSRIEALSNSE